MKKTLIYSVLILILAFPFFVRAAFNDVTLETSTILDVGGYELTVYGSSALLDEIIVNPTNFVVTLANGSSIVVASADRVDLANDAEDAYITSEVCSDTESRLGLADSTGGNPTITVTPSGTCTAPTVPPPPSSGGGGGGGGSSTRRDSPSETTTPSTPTPEPDPIDDPNEDAEVKALLIQLKALLEQLAAIGGTVPEVLQQYLTPPIFATYTRDLTIGSQGEDVRKLQLFLIIQNKGPRAIALAAVGATGYFGPLTQAALAEYQASVGIVPPAGYFGPITRAHIIGL